MNTAPERDARHHRRSRRWAYAAIAAVALALLGAIGGLTAQAIELLHSQTLTAERVKNDNLALAHAETVRREVEAVDLKLRQLRAAARQGELPLDLRDRLAAEGPGLPDLISLSLIGPDGRLLATSRPDSPAVNANFADRAYFRAQAGASDDRLFVDEPLRGRLSGEWVMALSRRAERADGGFGGVAVAAVSLAMFARLYEGSALGAQGSMALIGLDGITRVRRNGDKVSYGGDVRRSQLFEALRQAPAGHYVATAASDGVRRVVSYRQLDTLPLVVVVASSVDEVHAQVLGTERLLVGGAAAAAVLVSLLAALMVHALSRDARRLATLAEAERRLRLLLENSFDAILRTTLDGRVLAANAAACRLFGGDEDSLRAAGRHGLADGADSRLGALLQARERDARASGRLRMRRVDGGLFEAEVRSIVYTDSDGTPAASITVRDLTETLAAEAERTRIELRLRQSQKLESIGTLAGGIAHDFNNSLAAILGNAALLREALPAAGPGVEPLQRIERSAQRGRALVQQILTFSRRQPEQRQRLALQPLLREALSLLQATRPAGVQIELDLAAQPLVVVCDPTQVQQVLMNLCTNAWQAMAEHHGRIDVSLRAEPAAGDSPGHAVLSVRDDGQGMDEPTRERLFEPFFTTKPLGEGTGLGLAVVHGIVTAHGGTIGVHSVRGEGSCFEVRLPLAPGDAAAPAPAEGAEASGGLAAAHPRPGRGEQVLYVDDDAVLAVTVESLLQRAGWRVRLCSGAAEALALVEAEPGAFSAVVTDYNMPGLTGLDLCAALQRVQPELPVVVTSGYVTEELQAHAARHGVRHVMFKEYTLERLVPLLASVLGGREAPAAPPR